MAHGHLPPFKTDHQPKQFEYRLQSSGSSLRVLVAAACSAENSSKCPNLCDCIFNLNTSFIWVEDGLYELPLAAEIGSGYSGNRRFRFGIFVMSHADVGGAIVNNSVIVGVATNDVYIDTLGLSPYGTNFTDFNNPHPSILKL